MNGQNMKWLAMTVTTTTAAAEIVAEALTDCGSYGAMIADRADIDAAQKPDGYWDMIDPSVYDSLPEGAAVTGYFRKDASLADNLSALKTRLEYIQSLDIGISFGTLEISTDEIEELDWLNCWKQFYKPTRVGQRLVVKPSWEEYTPKDGDLIIHMDPGTAFGTGTHETTAMCLELSEQAVRPGDSVIDIGCGTAILSIASALQGASRVIAIDIDLLAVDCAKANVAKNNMEDIIEVKRGDLLSDTCFPADVIFANIVAGVIVDLAPDIPSRLKKGGIFICSGIIREREGDVTAALEPLGFTLSQARRRGEWVAMRWEYA